MRSSLSTRRPTPSALPWLLLAVIAPQSVGVPSAYGAPPAKVAVLTDGPSDLFEASVQLLRSELDRLMSDRRGAVAFPAAPTHVGDFTLRSARANLRSALSDPRYDIVVAIGFFAGLAVGAEGVLTKPVVVPFAAPELQGLPTGGRASGKRNLAYLTGLLDLERDLRRFREVLRQDESVFVIDEVLVPNLKDTQEFVNRSAGTLSPPQVVPVGATAEAILAGIPTGAPAVYLGPLVRLPREEIQALIDGLNARGQATYASGGRSWVEMGAFSTLVPEDEEERRMRRVALMVKDILRGEDPGTFDIGFERQTELVLNMATARSIRVSPRFELMTEATLLDDDAEGRGEPLSLRDAVDAALARNLDLGASRQNVAIADSRVRSAWSAFLPSIALTGDATWIDPDVASAFFDAERQLSYTGSVEQLIFSIRDVQSVRSSEADKRSAEAGVSTAELDVVSDVAGAYLEVLRTRTSERISRENLRLTRTNLAVAEVRVQVGTASRDELFRWQTEIAQSRADVIQASATRNQAEIALNQLLNREVETSFTTIDPLDVKMGLVIERALLVFVEDPFSFEIFRDFMAREAKRNAPERTDLEAEIASLEAQLDGQLQQLFIPTVSAQASLTDTPLRGGEGSEAIAGVAGIPERVDTQWMLGLNLNFEIFNYVRYAEIRERRQTLRQLSLQLGSVELAIDSRVRSALHQSSASRAAVSLSEEAAEAARQNLSLVTDRYRKGTVDVVRLIDAQTESFQAGLNAANALYDFLGDFVEVERAVGAFQFMKNQEQRDDFVRRVQAFAASKSPRSHSRD